MLNFISGGVVGVIVALFFVVNNGIIDQYYKLKQECEKNLPRNQVCVMKLVPQGE